MAEISDRPADFSGLFAAQRAENSAPSRRAPDFYLHPLHLPLGRDGDKTRIAVASVEHADWLQRHYGPVKIVPLPPKSILAALERLFRDHWADKAVCDLARHDPQFSASRVVTRGQGAAFIAIAVALLVSLILVPHAAGLFLIVLSAIAFCMNAMFRAVLLWVGADERPIVPEPPAIADSDLPLYSILVPLYREANMMPALLQALRALDYPGLLAQTPQTQHSCGFLPRFQVC